MCTSKLSEMRRLTAKYFILVVLSSTLIVTLWSMRKKRATFNDSPDDETEQETRPWKGKDIILRQAEGGLQVVSPERGLKAGSGWWERKQQRLQRKSGGAKIYVMAWRYSGQQAAGVQGLASLQCWAGQSGLPVEVVEPVMRHSELTSTLKPNNTGSMRLGDYFDMRYLNSMSRGAGYAQVIARSEFLKKAPKFVIFVRSEVRDQRDEEVWSSKGTAECYTENRGQVMGHVFNELRDLGYCIVKVAITEAGKLTRDKMTAIIGEWKDRNVILIVSLWKGPMSLAPKCQGIGSGSALSHFFPSRRLLQDAQRYNDLHIHNSSYTAVMIRLEHATMLTENSPQHYSIKGCLQELKQTVEKVNRGTGGHLPVVAADIGKYGTNTWKWAIKDHDKLKTAINDTWKVMDTLLHHQMSLEEWEGTFVEAAGGVTNEGYIAALQRALASRADCLVLMGGGSFQQAVLQEYLHIHKDDRKWCVELVCLHFRQQMTGVIGSARDARHKQHNDDK